MQQERIRTILSATLALLAFVLGIVATTQPKWLVCDSRVGYSVSFGLASWSDTADSSGSNCSGVWYALSAAPCNVGKAVTGLAAVAIALAAIALVLFVVMAAWKRPSAMQTAGHACVIIGGLLAAIAGITYAAAISGDLGFGGGPIRLNVCNVQPAPIALLAAMAVLLFVSSCLICTCCRCNCDDDMNANILTSDAPQLSIHQLQYAPQPPAAFAGPGVVHSQPQHVGQQLAMQQQQQQPGPGTVPFYAQPTHVPQQTY